MQTTKQPDGTLLITFADHTERERFLVKYRFEHSPGESAYGRWQALPSRGEPQHMELLPAKPEEADNPRSLTVVVRRFKLLSTAD